MERIESYYITLSVELFLKQHPHLEEYLKATSDDKLVSAVCRFLCAHMHLALSHSHHTHTDIVWSNRQADGPHNLHTTGDLPIPPTIERS